MPITIHNPIITRPLEYDFFSFINKRYFIVVKKKNMNIDKHYGNLLALLRNEPTGKLWLAVAYNKCLPIRTIPNSGKKEI